MKKWKINILFFIVFMLLGLIVFVIFSHMRPIFTGYADLAGRICLISILLAASLVTRKSTRFKKYHDVLSGFFIAALAMAVDFYLHSSEWLLNVLNIPIKTPAGIALDKLDSSIIIIVIILALTKLSGASLSSIYLTKNNIRKSLTIGIVAFLVCVAGSVFMAKIFGAQNLTLAKIWPWIPWILIFIFGNALNEELLFRGLFLKKMNPFAGRFLSNLAIAIPFTLHHTGVTYTNDTLMFLAYLLPLALVWGYIMQKNDSIWGSVLFHAGTDIPVILVIFSQL
ncbi:MAG: CPBP family intramembrane glutamic endopeptidase [Saccharofermentanales bacterium]